MITDLNALVIRQSAVIIDQLEITGTQNAYIDHLEQELAAAEGETSSIYEGQIANLEERNAEIMEAVGSWVDGEHPVNTGGQAAVLMTWDQYNKLRAAFGLSARAPKKASPARAPSASPEVKTILSKSAEQLAELLADAPETDDGDFE